MAIEIVDFPMKNGWIFPVRYVKLPEGTVLVKLLELHLRQPDIPSFVVKDAPSLSKDPPE